MEEKVLKTVHMWQITQMSAKYLPSISKKNLNSDNVSRLRPLFAPDIPYLISQAYTTSQTTAKLATLLPRQYILQTTHRLCYSRGIKGQVRGERIIRYSNNMRILFE